MEVFLRVAPLSMIFIVALYTPWCRYLGSRANISPQLYADNLKCAPRMMLILFLLQLSYTVSFVRAVGQRGFSQQVCFT